MNYSKSFALALLLTNATFLGAPALADQFTLPEEIGRQEAPRDTNIFQVEPSVIDERYYTSGRNERHQYIGKVLPVGSPIPDTDVPVKMDIRTSSVIENKGANTSTNTNTTTNTSNSTSGSVNTSTATVKQTSTTTNSEAAVQSNKLDAAGKP